MSYIEREPLLAAYDAAHQGPPGGARKLIEEAPAVEVVPLKPLCKWLAANVIKYISANQWEEMIKEGLQDVLDT